MLNERINKVKLGSSFKYNCLVKTPISQYIKKNEHQCD